MKGKLYVIGTGPGDKRYMTEAAIDAIRASEVIMGYKTYILLIEEFIEGKEVLASGMRKEVDRCTEAIEIAQRGKIVSLISSGDSGVYGMAGIVLELIEKLAPELDVEIVPGITSALSSASLAGAPLMNDFAVISLSDLMTPWEVIEKRLDAAGLGDFAIALYNPRSNSRTEQIEIARDILLRHRKPETPVALVRNAMRDDASVTLCTLAQIPFDEIDMVTTVLIGNSQTYIWNGKMITPRGYKI